MNVWSAIGDRIGMHRILKLMWLYPPYLGAGVRLRNIAPDLTSLEAELKLHVWNRNYVGTQFGGSLYSLCDPWFMLILMANLGPEFVVWDKSATIRFLRPGKGTVRARFEISREQIAAIRAEAEQGLKVEPTFVARIEDARGHVVAEVEKLLYVRRKKDR
jgi:hypothetical protein